MERDQGRERSMRGEGRLHQEGVEKERQYKTRWITWGMVRERAV